MIKYKFVKRKRLLKLDKNKLIKRNLHSIIKYIGRYFKIDITKNDRKLRCEYSGKYCLLF